MPRKNRRNDGHPELNVKDMFPRLKKKDRIPDPLTVLPVIPLEAR